jgi:hypothetical protein
MLIGIGALVTMFYASFMQGLMFKHQVEWDFLSFQELLRHIVSPTTYYILSISVITVVALTVFALIFWGIRLMTGFRIKRKIIHVALLLVWLGGIVLIVSTGMVEFYHHAWHNEKKETKMLPATDTLYLKSVSPEMKISNNPWNVYYDRENDHFYGMPRLSVYKSEDDRIWLHVVKAAEGKSKIDAYRYAEDISYDVTVRDSLLLFPTFFSVEPQNQWNFQFLHMRLYVPEGTVIIPDKLLCDKILTGNYFAHKWVMTKKGLHQAEE